MKAHLSFLCNGQCRWCKNYWDCSKYKKNSGKNFRMQRLEMAKQMKDIRQQCVDEQDKAAQIFTWCMVVAMHQKEGIGATRLTRACNEMRAFQARYKSKIDSGNRRKATEAMRDVLRGICDFTVRLPQNRAPRNYTVIRAGWECATLPKKGFGQRVVVRIGSTAYYMYFGHLSKINVAVGQKLKPGDLIGVEGSTGHSTGSHLHWEIRINDISTGYVSVHQYAGIPNVAGSTAYTSNWVAELFGPSNLKKSTSAFPQRIYNSVLQGALGIDKDGIFGANTEKMVKEFQEKHSLTVDGIVGTKTKATLFKLI